MFKELCATLFLLCNPLLNGFTFNYESAGISARIIIMKNIKRRTFLKTASAASIGALTPIKYSLSNESINGKILVVLELSGGNDGLNTIVPYGDDNYYKHRPKIGLKENKLLKIDDYFGFNPGIVGLENLYKEGKMAIIHGCGYDNPSFSHFTSMAYMHTAAPNSG